MSGRASFCSACVDALRASASLRASRRYTPRPQAGSSSGKKNDTASHTSGPSSSGGAEALMGRAPSHVLSKTSCSGKPVAVCVRVPLDVSDAD